MIDYTPTTEQVREVYWAARVDVRRPLDVRRPDSPSNEFNRWLAAHDADVRAAERECAEPSDAQVEVAFAAWVDGYETFDGRGRMRAALRAAFGVTELGEAGNHG